MIVHPKTKTLIRYADKDLSEEQADKIKYHLERCERCRKEYGILQRIEAVNAPKKDLLDNFKDRIVANLKEAKRVDQPICADIKATIGKVLVFQTGDDEGKEGFPGMGLKKGDTVRLLGDSRALIELNDGSTVYLNKDTEISLPSARYDMTMLVGEIFAMMKPQKKAFEICTPSAILGVIGTDFDARVTEKKETILQVLKGKVSFKNQSGSTIVKKKHRVEATKNAKPIPKKIKDTQTIYNWTIPMKRKKTERGWIMKKIIIGLVAVVVLTGVLAGGYFLYDEYFNYEPSSYTLPTTESETAVTLEQPLDVQGGVTTAVSQDDETLVAQADWEVGKRYIFQVEQISEGVVQMPGTKDSVKTANKYSQQVAISILKETSEGGREVELEFGRAAMDMETPNGKISIDSSSKVPNDVNKPEIKMMWDMVKAMSGTRFKMYVNSDGKVDKIEGVDEFFEKVKATLSPMVVEMLRQFFSEETMKEMTKNSLYGAPLLPDKPVQVGDTWPFQSQVATPKLGKVKMDLQYSFKRWEEHMGRRCALLEYTGTISIKKSADEQPLGMQMSLKDGTIYGKTWYDPAIGMTIDSSSEQHMTMEITMEMPGRRGMREQKMTSSMTQRGINKLIRIEDVE